MDIKIETGSLAKKRPDEKNLGFGKFYTDHMFVMPYSKENGWHNAAIVPFDNFRLSPASMVFHYAQECFEGLKAYRAENGQVRLFRPEKNAQRMAQTHRRLCIPPIDEADFVKAVRTFAKHEKSWVPAAPNTSLYIRPCTIATEAHLGVKPSEEYLFFIIASPSGAYYESGLSPIGIYVEEEMTRAAPGGMGAVKCGGNYAAGLAAQKKAQDFGCSQVLWLDGIKHKYVEEVGAMNCFFVVGDEVLTPPIGPGTVLPGITRLSCVELLAGWGYTVKEAPILIDDIIAAAQSGKLTEVFGTGTAAVISPVGQLHYKDQLTKVGSGGIGTLTTRLYNTLTGIQYGKLPDEKGWTVLLD